MKISQNIILIGSMGAGKTTVGRQLAAKLGREFVDCDTELENRTGVDIATIFDIEGEAGFRKREAALLQELLKLPEAVIATGGGVVVAEDNRIRIRRSGIVVYLETTVKQQLERLRMDKKRPLLSGSDREEILTELYQQRDPIYRELADVIVTSGQGSSSYMSSRILDAINQYLSEISLS